jgi:hypothetical protein
VHKLFLMAPNAHIPSYIEKAAPPVTVVHDSDLSSTEATTALRQFVSQFKAEQPN